MRALWLSALLVACSGSSDPPTTADAGSDAPADAPADTAPENKCATVRCDSGTTCDPFDGLCKAPKNPSLGATCSAAKACPATMTCLEELPDGYCSITPCSATSPCPMGASCVRIGGKPLCLAHCAIDADCRGGIEYKCQDASTLVVSGTRRVCYLPAFSCTIDADCPAPLKCVDGATCT